MKKKVMLLGAGLTLGSALIVTSAFAGIQGAQGYEAYKSAMKTSAAADSSTKYIALSMQDNGRELLSFTTKLKENEESASGQAVLQAGSLSQSFDFYHQDGKEIFKAGSRDTYEVVTDTGRKEWKGQQEAMKDPAFSQEMEKVVDALVGNLKNGVSLEKQDDGSKSVELKLSGSQIPTAVNVIGSVILKEMMNGQHLEGDGPAFGQDVLGLNVQQIVSQFPKLTDDVNVDEIALHAFIDENDTITNQQIQFTFSGKDAAGQAHEVVIYTDIETSCLNATTPDVLDLTGKKIETVQAARG